MLLESGEDVDHRDQVLALSTVYVNLMFSWTSCLRFALGFLNSFLVLAVTDWLPREKFRVNEEGKNESLKERLRVLHALRFQ